jgi:O-antigen/teichoic acid export membrane protein
MGVTRAGSRHAGETAVVARGVAWVGAGHVVSQLAWFGSLLFIAAQLPVDAFGSVSIAMVVVQVAWLLVGSGTRAGLIVTAGVSRGQVRRSVTINLAAGLGIGLAAALLARPLLGALSPGADPLVLQGLAASIALFGLSIVPLALLQRQMHFKRHAGANAAAAVLASAAAVAAVLSGAGVWALVVRQVLFQALLAVLAWILARPLLPAARAGDPPARRNPAGWWFFALAAIAFVSLNVDNVVVARTIGIAQVGLYSLAFTIAFAPLTQFAWQIGKVLFASAARVDEPAVAGARAARAARLTALFVWPLVSPAIVLAPLVLPRLLGREWQPMVLPFQLLMVAGAAHAVLAVMREFLLAAGNVRACLVTDLTWLAATVLALVVLVGAFGIAGAALAHVVLVIPLACAYVTLAARRLELAPGALWRAMRLIVVAVGAQALLTGLEAVLVEWAGATHVVAALAGALVGVVALVLLLAGGETPPQREIADVLGAARAARAAPNVPAAPAEPTAAPAAPAAPTAPAAPEPGLGRRPAAGPPATPGLALRLALVGLTAAAVAAGTIAARQPHAAAGLAAVGLAGILAFRAPVAHLLALVALTAIVPLAVQARVGSGGSVESAGVLPSDVLLLTGLARALLIVPGRPQRRLASVAAALTALFLLASGLQLMHAIALGRPVSGAGGEFRALLGFGALLVALPVLADPSQRRRLLAGLAWLALALGLWGIVQFAAHLQFYALEDPGDTGSFLTAGRVIGLFGFPVAAIVAVAVLSGAPRRRPGEQALLYGVVIANSAAMVLTFERTFVLVTLGGFALVFLRAAARQRVRLAVAAPAALACTTLALAVAAPAAFSAYWTRLSSIGSARTDPAVVYRVEESRAVTSQISQRPLEGSALGATILIGRPGTNRAPAPRRHAENGYLWLAWKVGIPQALIMCALLALAVVAPRPRGEDLAGVVLRRGCQAGVAAVAVASLTFASFNQIGITVVMGVLFAICVSAPSGAALPRARVPAGAVR